MKYFIIALLVIAAIPVVSAHADGPVGEEHEYRTNFAHEFLLTTPVYHNREQHLFAGFLAFITWASFLYVIYRLFKYFKDKEPFF